MSEWSDPIDFLKMCGVEEKKINSIKDAREALASIATELELPYEMVGRLAQENKRLKARNEKLERVLENTKAYIKGIKPPLGHDRHRLWLTLTAAIALTESEAARSGDE